MKAERHNVWVGAKECLDAISMVDINIHIQHLCIPFALKGVDGDGDIGQDAEATRVIVMCMM